jgi:hypothetical protein
MSTMDELFDGSDAHLLPDPQTSYILRAELPAISLALHKRTPYVYSNVSAGQLSIARHSGMCVVNSETYIYFAEFDELVRDDVLAFVHKRRGAAEALDRMAENARQLRLEL